MFQFDEIIEEHIYESCLIKMFVYHNPFKNAWSISDIQSDDVLGIMHTEFQQANVEWNMCEIVKFSSAYYSV